LETIGQLKNLRELNLRAQKITDAGMTQLSTLKNLVELNVGQTALSAKGLAPVAGLGKLEKLVLWKCQRIGDDAVATLGEMKSLKWLDIEGTGITEAGRAKLKAALPQCRMQ
jgi:hypothetical protein